MFVITLPFRGFLFIDVWDKFIKKKRKEARTSECKVPKRNKRIFFHENLLLVSSSFALFVCRDSVDYQRQHEHGQ